jgi:hypothetical protein
MAFCEEERRLRRFHQRSHSSLEDAPSQR